MRASSMALWALLCAGIVTGCAGVLPKPPELPPRTYLLSADPNEGEARPAQAARGELRSLAPTLAVSRPEAAAGYGSARIAYMDQDYRLDYYADHAWVDSPGAMLGPLLIDALRGSGAFAAVTENARGVGADLRLDTVIESLYQDFRSRPSQARVQLRVRLVDLQGRRVLATRVFTGSQPAPSDDAYGGVVAANRVLAKMLPEVAAFAAEAATRAERSRTQAPAAPRQQTGESGASWRLQSTAMELTGTPARGPSPLE